MINQLWFKVVFSIYVASVFGSYVIVDMEYKKHKDEYSEWIQGLIKFIFTTISFIPLLNTFICFRRMIHQIITWYCIRMVYKATDHIARKAGYKSMRHMIKEESKNPIKKPPTNE